MSVELHLRKSIDRHFAGRSSPKREAELREHLPDCAACRGYYDRQLLLAKLDPSSLNAETRLAHGLGIRAASLDLSSWFRPVGFASAAAACALLLVAVLPHVRSPPWVTEYDGVRGGHAAPAPKLEIYTVRTGSPSSPVDQSIAPNDELAFTYQNPSTKGWLMVFGVDEQSRVVWYYPAWTDAALNPTSVPISTEAGVHELSEAVRQSLTGKTLTLCGLFTDHPWSVREIEAKLGQGSGARLSIDGGVEDCHTLKVGDRP